MAVQILNMFLSVFQGFVSLFFTLEIAEGVSLGWVFMVVLIMFVLLKFFLKGDSDNG